MGLTEKRKRFFQIRGTCKVLVRYHAFGDYPERKFTEMEIKNLVRYGSGRVSENESSEAIPESFLFFAKDDEDRECKLVVLLDEVELVDENSTITKELIIVCSAYRET